MVAVVAVVAVCGSGGGGGSGGSGGSCSCDSVILDDSRQVQSCRAGQAAELANALAAKLQSWLISMRKLSELTCSRRWRNKAAELALSLSDMLAAALLAVASAPRVQSRVVGS